MDGRAGRTGGGHCTRGAGALEAARAASAGVGCSKKGPVGRFDPAAGETGQDPGLDAVLRAARSAQGRSPRCFVKLALKVTAAAILGALLVLAVDGFISARRDVEQFESDIRRDQ